MHFQISAHDARFDDVALDELRQSPDDGHFQEHGRRREGSDEQGRDDPDGGTDEWDDRRQGSDQGKDESIIQTNDQITDYQQGTEAQGNEQLALDIGTDLKRHLSGNLFDISAKNRRYILHDKRLELSLVLQHEEKDDRESDCHDHHAGNSGKDVHDFFTRVADPGQNHLRDTAHCAVQPTLRLLIIVLECSVREQSVEIGVHLFDIGRKFIDQISQLAGQNRNQ
ncbi:hypothetical protein SDC9_110339 [bioreactor metagenome]|uniref:Uncharacterized protein n=1 Tax=bioreactor metagenome TaxID=1076179 RepID=A0A645BD94_9ZZZZ